MTRVRPAQAGDAADRLRLRRALWPEGSEAEHGREIGAYLAGDAREPTQPDNEVSVAAHRALGFIDAGLVRCFRKELS